MTGAGVAALRSVEIGVPDVEGARAFYTDIWGMTVVAETDDALMESGTLERGVDLISKPFTRTDLLERVRGVLQKNVG